ncbi:hypothetical protein AB0M11_02595 [Streptomyces sp. NPDC051987]|uniref:hypothetical protein n=1 Tax=Streptomyces sp. NPDC051987 TaxID=3155808 RepID=UPI00344774B2
MAITDDLRKTLSDPTPLYFAAGTADLALQQAKKVPGLVEQLRAEAPARIEAVRKADPKAVQEKAAARAKEAGAKAKEAQASLQSKVNDFIVSLDGDLKKLGESAQDFALRQVGVAAEYAVKARETYEKVAEHGEQAVKTWRGEAAEEIEDLAIAVEGKAETVQDDEKKAEAPKAAETRPAAVKKAPLANAKKAPAPRKATPVKKTTPPAK